MSNIHIIDDRYLRSALAELCSENTFQPRINDLIRELYSYLVKAVLNAEFPSEHVDVRTRMAKISDQGVWSGDVISRSVPTVTINVLRAGSVPSQICYDMLNRILQPELVRQDHVVMSRMTDSNGKVTGSHFGDSKIGGSIDNAFVLLPDPMGATGSSISEAISYYKNSVPGKARRYIAMHLIITPEYIKRMQADHPDVVVYALRLDRGLTDNQYIVPGGGGFGEIMNNSYC
jgi:uracil phosphoribosyltransferase